MSADVGSVGRSVATGTGWRCRGVIGCGRNGAAALRGVWVYSGRQHWRCGRSVVADRMQPAGQHREGWFRVRFCCEPLPFSFVEKEKTIPLGECGLLYETGRRMQNGPDTPSGPFRSRCNSVAVLVLQLLPGTAELFFGYSVSALLGKGCSQNGTAIRRKEGRDGDITPRRPRFGALSAPCGALFRKGRGEAPAGARR